MRRRRWENWLIFFFSGLSLQFCEASSTPKPSANHVQFFSNSASSRWISFLNLKSTFTEKKKPPAVVSDLLIRATISKGSKDHRSGHDLSGTARRNLDSLSDASERSDKEEYATSRENKLHPSNEEKPTNTSASTRFISTITEPTRRLDEKKMSAEYTSVKTTTEGADYSIRIDHGEGEAVQDATDVTRSSGKAHDIVSEVSIVPDESLLPSSMPEGSKQAERAKGTHSLDDEDFEGSSLPGGEGKRAVGDSQQQAENKLPDKEDKKEADILSLDDEDEEGSAVENILEIDDRNKTSVDIANRTFTPEEEEDEEPIANYQFEVPKAKSKIVVKEMASIDTRLFERDEMSMRIRDEQVASLRTTLTNVSALEEATGEGHGDLGGSFVLPILAAARYDNNTVPLIFADIPVHVRVQLVLLYLGNFDSHLMEYTVDAEMNMRWFDLRLANNYTKPIRVREKEIIDKIWRPDPYFVNSKFSYFHRVSFPNFRMIITPQGLISYTMRVSLLPTCPMIFCRFPHDRQSCDLQMSSIAYPRSFVRFSWHEQAFSLQSEVTLPELHVTRIFSDTCAVEGKLIASSCLRLVFHLKRDGSRFIVEKYIPSALAMMFGWVAPYVPYNYEEVRIVTPITVLLTLVQMEKGEQQVRTSYLTLIDVWFAFMKLFTVISLLESLTVLALIKRSRAMEKAAERAANEFERAEMELSRHLLRRAVRTLDRLSRAASPIAFLVFLLYYVFILSQGGENDCM